MALNLACIDQPPSSSTEDGFFFVGTKECSLLPCSDYWGLNNITAKNHYPMPLISSFFENRQAASVFFRNGNRRQLIREKVFHFFFHTSMKLGTTWGPEHFSDIKPSYLYVAKGSTNRRFTLQSCAAKWLWKRSWNLGENKEQASVRQNKAVMVEH